MEEYKIIEHSQLKGNRSGGQETGNLFGMA